jgi:hypothetical protein
MAKKNQYLPGSFIATIAIEIMSTVWAGIGHNKRWACKAAAASYECLATMVKRLGADT